VNTTPTHLDLDYDKAVELYRVNNNIGTKKQVVQDALDGLEGFSTHLNKAKKLLLEVESS